MRDIVLPDWIAFRHLGAGGIEQAGGQIAFQLIAMPVSSESSLTRDRAWACVTLNFSLSGLGSLKAGRVFAGIGQLVAVFAGFILLCAWMLKWIYRVYQAEIGEPLSPRPADWMWELGVAGFTVSYLWMLITCVDLMRQAKTDERKKSQNVPPRLADLPGKPPKLK